MELIIAAVAVAAIIAAFVFWPRVSEKIDDVQEDITEAREKVEAAIDEVIDDVEEAVEKALDKLPTKGQLMKLTKAKIDELAADLGIELDRRQTKEKMVAELQKQAKKAKQ
jgi:type II secretory pathway component PulM